MEIHENSWKFHQLGAAFFSVTGDVSECPVVTHPQVATPKSPAHQASLLRRPREWQRSHGLKDAPVAQRPGREGPRGRPTLPMGNDECHVQYISRASIIHDASSKFDKFGVPMILSTQMSSNVTGWQLMLAADAGS